MDLSKIIDQLIDVIHRYDEAADKFIQKVDSGRARSVETYNELKVARAASRIYAEEEP